MSRLLVKFSKAAAGNAAKLLLGCGAGVACTCALLHDRISIGVSGFPLKALCEAKILDRGNRMDRSDIHREYIHSPAEFKQLPLLSEDKTRETGWSYNMVVLKPRWGYLPRRPESMIEGEALSCNYGVLPQTLQNGAEKGPVEIYDLGPVLHLPGEVYKVTILGAMIVSYANTTTTKILALDSMNPCLSFAWQRELRHVPRFLGSVLDSLKDEVTKKIQETAGRVDVNFVFYETILFAGVLHPNSYGLRKLTDFVEFALDYISQLHDSYKQLPEAQQDAVARNFAKRLPLAQERPATQQRDLNRERVEKQHNSEHYSLRPLERLNEVSPQ